MTLIYALRLSEGRYYIGKSKASNFQKRIQSHNAGTGCSFTKKYPPIETLEVINDCSPFDEDKYTKMYMDKYGIDNVRGGSYVQIELPLSQKESLTRELRGANDLCFKCGGNHFVKNCDVVSIDIVEPSMGDLTFSSKTSSKAWNAFLVFCGILIGYAGEYL